MLLVVDEPIQKLCFAHSASPVEHDKPGFLSLEVSFQNFQFLCPINKFLILKHKYILIIQL